MKLESHIHLLCKDHMNILNIQNTIVSCLPLCFCSHLVDLTLFYFKIQQAVLSWHFKHAAIMVKYLPNVFCFFSIASFRHLRDCTFYSLSMIPNIYHWTANFYPFPPFFPPLLWYPPITLIHLFNSFICFCEKHGENISVSLPYEVTHLFSSPLFSHLFFCTVKVLK